MKAKKMVTFLITGLMLFSFAIYFPNQNKFLKFSIEANAAEGRLYNQNDSKWKSVTFSKYATSGNDMYTSGCGIFSFCNAIYALNGNTPDAVEVATWAVNNGSYQPGNGGLYRQPFYNNVESAFGSRFNFKIDGQYYGSVTDSRLISHLQNGGVAAIHVSGHFMAITGYNGSYHVIESAVYSGRGLQADSWVSASKLSSGLTKVDWYALISNSAPTDKIPPTISNIAVIGQSAAGYTVQCTVTDSGSGVNRVEFPTWNLNEDSSGNNQDDIIWGKAAQNGSTFTYTVNINDHNNEQGYYLTHIYAWDNAGNQSSASIESAVCIESEAPTILETKVIQQSSTGYVVQCEVYDNDSGIARVAFPTWTTHTDKDGNDQDDIVWSDGNINGSRVTFEVKISDHNNELGGYRTHIYAYDRCGNWNWYAVPDVIIEQTPPTISDIKIVEQDNNGYTVQCKVIDDGSGIDRVEFPTWTLKTDSSGNDQDDIIWGKGTSSANTYTYRVNTSEHNNELGTYRTHIYAWDKCGNQVSAVVEDITVNKEYTLKVNPNGGTYNNSTSVSTKSPKLIYNTSNWYSIGSATMTGYSLTGYYTAATGGTKVYDENGIALDTEYFNNHKYIANSDLTVYAQWTPNQYTLTVNPNGGTYDSSTSPVTKTPNLIYNAGNWWSIGKATRSGYTLTGYYTAITGGTKVYDANGEAVDSQYWKDKKYQYTDNLTVYAQWEAIKGDANSDNNVNVADAVMLQKWILGSGTLTNWQAADLNNDEKIDVFDMVLMRKLLTEQG